MEGSDVAVAQVKWLRERRGFESVVASRASWLPDLLYWIQGYVSAFVLAASPFFIQFTFRFSKHSIYRGIALTGIININHGDVNIWKQEAQAGFSLR